MLSQQVAESLVRRGVRVIVQESLPRFGLYLFKMIGAGFFVRSCVLLVPARRPVVDRTQLSSMSAVLPHIHYARQCSVLHLSF